MIHACETRGRRSESIERKARRGKMMVVTRMRRGGGRNIMATVQNARPQEHRQLQAARSMLKSSGSAISAACVFSDVISIINIPI